MKNSNTSQFKQTYRMFADYLQISEKQLSYDEWLNRPDDQKAALLFVNFYEQISLAWFKVRGEHTYEEDGVSEAIAQCSYLCGFSTKKPTRETAIRACLITEKTFKPSFIYSAMRNAFSSLNYDRRACRSCYVHQDDDKERKTDALLGGAIKVIGQYTITENGDELDLFESIGNKVDMLAEIDRAEMWSIIENSDLNTKDAVDRLINGLQLKPSQLEIVDELKVKLAKFVIA